MRLRLVEIGLTMKIIDSFFQVVNKACIDFCMVGMLNGERENEVSPGQSSSSDIDDV